MDVEVASNLEMKPLEDGGFVATSADLPGLVVQGRTRAETMELAQANARILMETYRDFNQTSVLAAPAQFLRLRQP